MKYLAILIFTAFIVVSCNPDKPEQTTTKSIVPINTINPEIIKMEFAVSFIGQSVVYFDLSKNTILISKVNIVCFPPDANPDSYLTPEEELIRIDTNANDIIQDSIINKFNLADYESNIDKGYDDGFFINVLIAYNNDSLALFDLQNNMSTNQQTLLIKSLNQIISNSKNKQNVEYFSEVLKTISR